MRSFYSRMLLLLLSTTAAANEPFSPGFGMTNQNTIFWENSPTNRQPWCAAALFGDDSMPVGWAISVVSYYAEMHSLTDIVRVTAGFWYTKRRFTIKGAFSQLDALDQYYNQRAFLSFGLPLYPFKDIRLSIEMEQFRCGLKHTAEDENFTASGITAYMHKKVVNVVASCSHIVVERASDRSFEPPLTLGCILSTARHRYGAQGIGFEYIKEYKTRFRFSFGQGFWIHNSLGTFISLSTNPASIGLGIELLFPRLESGAGYVFHPVLGWSRGVHTMYPLKK